MNVFARPIPPAAPDRPAPPRQLGPPTPYERTVIAQILIRHGYSVPAPAPPPALTPTPPPGQPRCRAW